MNLPLPKDTLANCCWLPRFVKKARLTLTDSLHSDYTRAFCHTLGVDYQFMKHFGLDKESFLKAVEKAGDDDSAIAAWFLSLPGVTPDSIAAWNEASPCFGQPGKPMEKTFQVVVTRLYNIPADIGLTTVYDAIYWDEVTRYESIS